MMSIKTRILVFKYYCYVVKRFLTRDMWYIIWNRTIKMAWNKLWIRKDEFHSSLDLDLKAMMVMNSKQRAQYNDDIARRRKIAHDREFKEDYAEGERLLKEDYGLDLQELRELNKTADEFLKKQKGKK